MSVEATGRILRTERGRNLVLERSLAQSVEDSWARITDPELTAEWFGDWDGDGRSGSTVRVRMAFESGEPEIKVGIRLCDAPHRLVLQTSGEDGGWLLELRVLADGDDSVIHFVHHLDDDADVGDIGPGWEYYLDLLVAACEGTEEPMFDHYFPALREEYLARESRAVEI